MKQRFVKSFFQLAFLFLLNIPITAQVEVKLNPPLALFGGFQTAIEIPINQKFSFETEFLFVAIDGDTGGGVIAHFKYYFNPDFGNDKLYIGLLGGGLSSSGDGLTGLGFEAGYKWMGKRSILVELGVGLAGVSDDYLPVLPYGRLMLGYRFPKKERTKY